MAQTCGQRRTVDRLTEFDTRQRYASNPPVRQLYRFSNPKTLQTWDRRLSTLPMRRRQKYGIQNGNDMGFVTTGIVSLEAARRLARLRLLGVWREATCYHFLQIDDFLDAATAGVVNEAVRGTYGLGDEQPVTIQEFLDGATRVWGLPRPWRLPWRVILAAATASEAFAGTFGTVAPLTRDFVRLGRVPHCCHTHRMRRELLPQLKYPTFATGKETLRY